MTYQNKIKWCLVGKKLNCKTYVCRQCFPIFLGNFDDLNVVGFVTTHIDKNEVTDNFLLKNNHPYQEINKTISKGRTSIPEALF